MTTVGDRISQLSSAISVYGGATPTDDRNASDLAHAVRRSRDELVALSCAATRNASNVNVGSTSDTFVSLAQVPQTPTS